MNATSLTGDALVAAHKSAVRKLRLLSIAFPVLFVGLIVWNLWSIAEMIKNIDAAGVGAELSDRVALLVPDINAGLSEVADSVQPALMTALETQSLEIAPKIEARLQTDVDRTITGARNELSTSVSRSMETAKTANTALLLREFPELAADPAAQAKVLAALENGVKTWELRQLDATVAEHVIAIDQLRATLQKSYTHPAGREADPEDALMTWLNLVNEHIGGESKILESNTKAKPAVATAKK